MPYGLEDLAPKGWFDKKDESTYSSTKQIEILTLEDLEEMFKNIPKLYGLILVPNGSVFDVYKVEADKLRVIMFKALEDGLL